MVSCEILKRRYAGTGCGPPSLLCRGVIGTRELFHARPVTKLDQIETILHSRIDGTEVVEMRYHATGGRGRIEVIKTVPVVLTSQESFLKLHIEILV